MTRRLLGGSGLLLLAVLTVVIAGARPLRGAASAQAQTTTTTYQSVYDGWKWWHVYCYRCHGVDAVGTTNAPRLIDPNFTRTPAVFLRIVLDGVPNTAMQAWDKLLTRKQVSEIHLYVRARADKVLPPGRPDEVGPKGGRWVPPAGWPEK